MALGAGLLLYALSPSTVARQGEPTQAERQHGRGMWEHIGRVDFIVKASSCSDWSAEVLELFQQPERPRFWRGLTLSHVELETPEGAELRSTYRTSDTAILVFAPDGELIAAHRSKLNVPALARWLGRIACGQGHHADLQARIEKDPKDTQALWELAEMQRASRRFGDTTATYDAIRRADPEGRTPAGEALEHRKVFGRFAQVTAFLKPELVEFDVIEGKTAAARSAWVRFTSYMNLAALTHRMGRTDDCRRYLRLAWEHCPDERRPELAYEMRFADFWPTEGTGAEPWLTIEAEASEAERRFVGTRLLAKTDGD